MAHLPDPYADRPVFGVVDREDEPAFSKRIAWGPRRAVAKPLISPRFEESFWAVAFHLDAEDFKLLIREPGLRDRVFVAVAWPGWVSPEAYLVAFDWQLLDHSSFFRHDCSFAAIAADFEGGGVRFSMPVKADSC